MNITPWSKRAARSRRLGAAFTAWLGLAVMLAACGGPPAPQKADEKGQAPAASEEAPLVAGPERRILAFGDSLFAGYGVGRTESYPAALQKSLRKRGINAQIVNAGVSGDTTAAGLQRFGFVLDGLEAPPDLVIIELGGNDLLRGIEPAETRANIAAMLAELQKRKIPALLMGMRSPPNYGLEYQAKFDRIYGDLAGQYGAALVPFFLEAIYRDPSLFQSDHIHPTRAGVAKLVAATEAAVIKALPEPEADKQ